MMLRVNKIINRRKKKEELRKASEKLLPDVCPKCGHGRATDKGLKIVCRRCGYVLLRYRDLDQPEKKKKVVEKVKEKPEEKEAHGINKLLRWFNSS